MQFSGEFTTSFTASLPVGSSLWNTATCISFWSSVVATQALSNLAAASESAGTTRVPAWTDVGFRRLLGCADIAHCSCQRGDRSYQEVPTRGAEGAAELRHQRLVEQNLAMDHLQAQLEVEVGELRLNFSATSTPSSSTCPCPIPRLGQHVLDLDVELRLRLGVVLRVAGQVRQRLQARLQDCQVPHSAACRALSRPAADVGRFSPIVSAVGRLGRCCVEGEPLVAQGRCATGPAGSDLGVGSARNLPIACPARRHPRADTVVDEPTQRRRGEGRSRVVGSRSAADGRPPPSRRSRPHQTSPAMSRVDRDHLAGCPYRCERAAVAVRAQQPRAPFDGPS